MVQMVSENPLDAEELVQRIIHMASGVFLWVKLVVRSLVSGFRNGDNLDDLGQRLQSLPTDLESLFSAMLGKVEPMYRKQTSELFQIVRLGAELAGEQNQLLAYTVSVAEDDPGPCLAAAVDCPPVEEVLGRVQKLQRRMRSRCGGLLELHVPGAHAILSDLNLTSSETQHGFKFDAMSCTVQYLHRTVAEYLHRDQVWNGLLQHTADSDFNPFRNLSYAYLQMIKATALKNDVCTRDQARPWHWAKRLLYCARMLEATENEPDDYETVPPGAFDHEDNGNEGSDYDAFDYEVIDDEPPDQETIDDETICREAIHHISQVAVLDEMDKALLQHNKGMDYYIALTDTTNFRYRISTFFLFAVHAGLHRYVDAKLGAGGLDAHLMTDRNVLSLALQLRPDKAWGFTSDYASWSLRVEKMTEVLLRHGANPNEVFNDPSFWSHVMYNLLFAPSDDSRLHLGRLALCCIRAGANPNAPICLCLQQDGTKIEYAPLDIVRRMFVKKLYVLAPWLCPVGKIFKVQETKKTVDLSQRSSTAVQLLGCELEAMLVDRGAIAIRYVD